MWRLALDTVTDRLALEVRDGDVLLARFYTLSLSDFTLNQLQVPNEPAWWVGLEDAQDGSLLLHGYGDRKLGQHKGITALDAATNTVRWECPSYAFYSVVASGVAVYTADNPEGTFKVLDTLTGKTVQQNLTQQQALAATVAHAEQRYSGHLRPHLYLEGESYFEQVKDFLKDVNGCNPLKAIEYAETGSAFVVSYYCEEETGCLQNFIAVFNLSGELLLKEVLATQLKGIGSDTFFIFKRNLYFIRDKNTLQVFGIA